MRSYAREAAFCKIYTFLMSGVFDGDFSQFEQDKLTAEDLQFATEIVNGVIKDKERLDSTVAEFSRSFKLSRIYRLDLAALEMAIWEIDNTDTPCPVVINEAVSLVKKYSTEKSTGYVNGILAAYVRSLQ